MRKRLFSALLAFCMVLSLLPSAALAEESDTSTSPGTTGGAFTLEAITAQSSDGITITRSTNKNNQSYTNWPGHNVNSYLYDNGDGLTRVEYTGGKVVVEDYKEKIIEDGGQKLIFNAEKSLSLELPLPIWGGFFAGEYYNFVICGQNNPNNSNNVEVFRIIRYDKEWNEIDYASIYGANTKRPFAFGSLRCAELDGYLYIRTCHDMYNGHQSNMFIISVRG